ncbi:MAG: hypothetical protein DDT38_00496 [Firmicutes bacterium]|nr:hypothetical protein [candidate division NPL-UPA2 bacterium]
MFRHPGALHASLGQHRSAVRTRELIADLALRLIYRHFPENHLAGTGLTDKDVRPDGVVYLTLGFTVGMAGLIHPATFGFHFIQDAFGFALEGLHIHRRVVVISDEGSGRR